MMLILFAKEKGNTMEKNEIFLAVLSTILGSTVLNGILTHFLYKNKLKKELQSKGHEMIANEIGKSLNFVRNMELKLTFQEIYNISEEIDNRGSQVSLFGGECIYLEIFNNLESFNEFINLVQQCRVEHEKNLSVQIALNLVFIDKYIRQLFLFMSELGPEEMLPVWGTIFIFDLQKWQKKMDKLLIKEINKYGYKLESHETKKWNRLRKRELVKQYEETILFYLLKGKCRKKDRKKMEYISNMIQQIRFSKKDETV